MSVLPHASEALVHRHVLLRDLLRRALAMVLFTSHEVDLIYRKRERPLQSFARAEKSKEIGMVASAGIFKIGALGRYLKPWDEGVVASGRAKGNHS